MGEGKQKPDLYLIKGGSESSDPPSNRTDIDKKSTPHVSFFPGFENYGRLESEFVDPYASEAISSSRENLSDRVEDAVTQEHGLDKRSATNPGWFKAIGIRDFEDNEIAKNSTGMPMQPLASLDLDNETTPRETTNPGFDLSGHSDFDRETGEITYEDIDELFGDLHEPQLPVKAEAAIIDDDEFGPDGEILLPKIDDYGSDEAIDKSLERISGQFDAVRPKGGFTPSTPLAAIPEGNAAAQLDISDALNDSPTDPRPRFEFDDTVDPLARTQTIRVEDPSEMTDEELQAFATDATINIRTEDIQEALNDSKGIETHEKKLLVMRHALDNYKTADSKKLALAQYILDHMKSRGSVTRMLKEISELIDERGFKSADLVVHAFEQEEIILESTKMYLANIDSLIDSGDLVKADAKLYKLIKEILGKDIDLSELIHARKAMRNFSGKAYPAVEQVSESRAETPEKIKRNISGKIWAMLLVLVTSGAVVGGTNHFYGDLFGRNSGNASSDIGSQKKNAAKLGEENDDSDLEKSPRDEELNSSQKTADAEHIIGGEKNSNSNENNIASEESTASLDNNTIIVGDNTPDLKEKWTYSFKSGAINGAVDGAEVKIEIPESTPEDVEISGTGINPTELKTLKPGDSSCALVTRHYNSESFLNGEAPYHGMKYMKASAAIMHYNGYSSLDDLVHPGYNLEIFQTKEGLDDYMKIHDAELTEMVRAHYRLKRKKSQNTESRKISKVRSKKIDSSDDLYLIENIIVEVDDSEFANAQTEMSVEDIVLEVDDSQFIDGQTELELNPAEEIAVEDIIVEVDDSDFDKSKFDSQMLQDIASFNKAKNERDAARLKSIEKKAEETVIGMTKDGNKVGIGAIQDIAKFNKEQREGKESTKAEKTSRSFKGLMLEKTRQVVESKPVQAVVSAVKKVKDLGQNIRSRFGKLFSRKTKSQS